MDQLPDGAIHVHGEGNAPLSGVGMLFWLRFRVLATPTDSTPIVLADPLLGNGHNPRFFFSKNGKFTATAQCEPGKNIIITPTTALESNSPNPVFRRTTLRFMLADAGRVRIDVLDPLGRIVATPIDADFTAGEKTLEWNAPALRSGTYFLRMTAAGKTFSRTLVMRE
jgi:hypothetical protein